jgi:hypothetical protein
MVIDGGQIAWLCASVVCLGLAIFDFFKMKQDPNARDAYGFTAGMGALTFSGLFAIFLVFALWSGASHAKPGHVVDALDSRGWHVIYLSDNLEMATVRENGCDHRVRVQDISGKYVVFSLSGVQVSPSNFSQSRAPQC